MLKDSSEIQEAIQIFDSLIAESAIIRPDSRFNTGQRRGGPKKKSFRRPLKSPAAAVQIEPEVSGKGYRGDRLENTLYIMCKRGGFVGAVLADNSGLPLAVYNSPVTDEAIAAFTTVLGDALEKAGRLLKQTEANTISMDINYTEKAVLRRFLINDSPYFLMTICPQEVDERAEVELSIDQVTSILKKPGS